MARFIPAWESDQNTRIPPRDVAGFRQKVADGWDYYVTTAAWSQSLKHLPAAAMASPGSPTATSAKRCATRLSWPSAPLGTYRSENACMIGAICLLRSSISGTIDRR